MLKSVRHFRKATIKEVAAQAGVSTTTVSLFVKGNESVCSVQTAERIRLAISSLNYTPSALTKGLHRSASTTLGVCLPHPLDYDLSYGTSFFEQIWRGVLHQADIENYSLLHYPQTVRHGESCDSFLDGRVDGLLLFEHENIRSPRLVAAGMPLVLICRSQDVEPGCSTVYADESKIVGMALDYLWDLGHRQIAFVAGPVDDRPPPTSPSGEFMPHDDVACLRLANYEAWMQARGTFNPSMVGLAKSWDGSLVPGILDRWLLHERTNRPTAVLCSNDLHAAAIIKAAKLRDIKIPNDLSVIGIDNSAIAPSSDPPLTSVDVGTDLIGVEAVRELVRQFHSAPGEARVIVTPPKELVIRSSATRPKHS